MGPVGLEMGLEGPVCQKVGGGGKNWFQTQLQRYTSHGRRGRGLGVSPRLLCPRDSPGKNTGVGYHALLQGISTLHMGQRERMELRGTEGACC